MASRQQQGRQPRRFLVISDDTAITERLRSAMPQGWVMAAAAGRIEELGDWNDLLLYRFVLLDLDGKHYDPSQVVDTLRRDYMLAIPLLGFGGRAPLRERLRRAGADRFCGRGAIERLLPRFFEQYGW